jgi:hypothetical protein
MQTTEPLLPQPTAFEFQVAIGKLKRHKSPGFDQTPAEMIQTGRKILYSEIHKLIKLIWNK